MNDADHFSLEPEEDPQPNQSADYSRYPLFETMLRSKGLKLQATYTCQDIASLFGVTARTIQSKVADGTLPSRKLIGGGRFLPLDIENLPPQCRWRTGTNMFLRILGTSPLVARMYQHITGRDS